jgi:alcohol dehydrogenase
VRKDNAVTTETWKGLAVGTFRIPTEVVFGDGVAQEIGQRARVFGVRALVVSDPGIVRAGLLDPLKQSLSDAGVTFDLYTDISPNPRAAECEAAATKAREIGAEVIIAIG